MELQQSEYPIYPIRMVCRCGAELELKTSSSSGREDIIRSFWEKHRCEPQNPLPEEFIGVLRAAQRVCDSPLPARQWDDGVDEALAALRDELGKWTWS